MSRMKKSLKAIALAACVSVALSAPAVAEEFHDRACTSPSNGSPWHVSNLYDCKAGTLYIPYQLWTGAPWDGRKAGPCMHEADNDFLVNARSRTNIKGPVNWTNPRTGEALQVWVRKKARGTKVQYFACHEAGIGRVYDSRRDRSWHVGRCKFPAGRGWRIGERRKCQGTSIEITRVDLNDKGEMTRIEFKWWSGRNLDHVYRYEPGQGMTNAWKQ